MAVTVSVYVAGWNVAVAVFAPVIVAVHVFPLTLVQPDQLLKSELPSGTAVSVTVAPFATSAVHPAGSLHARS